MIVLADYVIIRVSCAGCYFEGFPWVRDLISPNAVYEGKNLVLFDGGGN